MSVSSDCLIIGGGLIGMLTAREFALAGMQVQLLERGNLGTESSWAGGGILSPLYPWRYAAPVSVLARESHAIYRELIDNIRQESGIDPELRQSGLLMPACDEVDEAKQWAAQYGADLQQLDAKQCTECAPELAPTIAEQGALWLPKVTQVRNPRFVKALKRSLEQLGVKIATQQSVSTILVEKGVAKGAQTQDEHYYADNVVITMGAWSADLLDGLGKRPEIAPVKGQMLLYKTPKDSIKRVILHQDRYVIPRKDGRVLVGSTLEHVGFDKSTTDSAKADIVASAERIAPLLVNCEIERHWAGLRPGSPSGIPYIGGHQTISQLYVNAGHYRYGVILGPASARLITDIVLNNKTKIHSEPYSIDAERD